MAKLSGGATLPWTQSGGVTQVSLAEIRARARRLLTSQGYLAALERSLLDRSIPPAVEVLLYHYAYGKPAETLNVTTSHSEDLSTLSTSELMQRMEDVKRALSEAQAVEDALEATGTIQ